MHRVFLGLLTALAVVALSHYAAAQDGKRPKDGPPPRPHAQSFDHHKGGMDGHRMQMPPKADGPRVVTIDARAIFNRLDKNHDGKLSFEEFAAGLHELHLLFAGMPVPGRQMPWPGNGFWLSRDKMFAYGAQFAKSCFAKGSQHRHCPSCGAAMKGPQHRGPNGWAKACQDGRQWTGHHHRHHGDMGWGKYAHHHHHGNMGWGKYAHHHHHGDMERGKYAHHHHHGDMGSGEYGHHHHGDMEWAEHGSRHHGGMGWENGPMHFAGREMADGYPPPELFRGPRYEERREWFDGRQAPEGRQRFEGRERPEGKRPEMKKPAAKKPEVKMGAERRDVEFRLAALERQQAEILSLLRVVVSEQKTKEIAKGGNEYRHGERKSHHEDRD